MDSEIVITTMMGMDSGEIGNSLQQMLPAMSTVTPGDTACANYFDLRTLYMNYCVIQHAKSPFVAYEEARHRKVIGLRSIIYKLQIQSMDSLI